jgi:hypothetical protein
VSKSQNQFFVLICLCIICVNRCSSVACILVTAGCGADLGCVAGGFGRFLFGNRFRGTRAEASCAEGDQASRIGQRADAAAGFDLDRAALAHQGDVVIGRALGCHGAVGLLHEAKPGAGFDEGRAGPFADLAEFDFEVVAREVVGLEDHLGDDVELAADIDDGADILFNLVPLLLLSLADVDHHVELAGALFAGPASFGRFDRRWWRAVREADHRADDRFASFEQLDGRGNHVGLHADAKRAEVAAKFARRNQIRIGLRRMQDRVINQTNDRSHERSGKIERRATESVSSVS